MIKKFFISIILLNLSLYNFSQNISGQIIDSETKNPIPFAGISIKGTTLATVSDFEGNFNFEIPENHFEGKISVSCVGFKSKDYNIVDVAGNNNLILELISDNIEIDEVIVEKKSLLPYTIMKKAVHFIPDNYLNIPYNYEFYFSSEDRLKNSESKKRELIVLMSDQTGYQKQSIYQTFKNINYLFLNVRRNFEPITLSDGSTNLDEMLEYDIVRHKGNILDIDRLNQFEIVLKDEIVYNGDSVWVLAYKAQEPSLLVTGGFYDYFYSGEIFINKEDYAVLYNTTTVKSSNQSSISRTLYVNRENAEQDIKNVFSKFEVQYSKQNGIYVLNKISSETNYSYAKEVDNQIDTKNSELKVTNIITKKPNIIDGRIYLDELEYVEAFWSSYKIK
jgi:hypothetical protein